MNQINQIHEIDKMMANLTTKEDFSPTNKKSVNQGSYSYPIMNSNYDLSTFYSGIYTNPIEKNQFQPQFNSQFNQSPFYQNVGEDFMGGSDPFSQQGFVNKMGTSGYIPKQQFYQGGPNMGNMGGMQQGGNMGYQSYMNIGGNFENSYYPLNAKNVNPKQMYSNPNQAFNYNQNPYKMNQMNMGGGGYQGVGGYYNPKTHQNNPSFMNEKQHYMGHNNQNMGMAMVEGNYKFDQKIDVTLRPLCAFQIGTKK
jgi:hypothetical protein